MKLSSTLTVVALLAAGAASGATTPSSAPTATPASAVQPAHNHRSDAACEKLARDRGLTGDDVKKFVKECRDGKKPG